MRLVLPLLMLAGCSDWLLFGREDPQHPPGGDPLDLTPEDDLTPEFPETFVSREDVDLWTDQWWGSQPFSDPRDFVDARNRVF
jgi:hypothetical protein